MQTQNSFSELIDKFVLLQNNSLSIIQKLNEAIVSDNEEISFKLYDMNGEENEYNFPSFGFLKESMNRIDNTLKKLMGIGDGESIMQMPDGTFKRIVTVDLATEPANILNLVVPSQFGVKPNWFFESFLSPSLHISVDVSKYIPQSGKRILVKRVIVLADTISQKTFFDVNYKGRNDIKLEELYADLNNNGILYHEDEEVKELPLSILQYEGTFDVIDIKDIRVIDNDGIEKVTRQYFLNKLTYNNNLNKVPDSLSLKIGDTLVVEDTTYQVSSVDASINAITLRRLSGYDTISIGADILRVYSSLFAPKKADVDISFNERQVVFFKAIEESNNIISKQWSPGIGIFTNDLKIVTTTGEQDLKTFYYNNVMDFSNIIMSMAKEKTIPSIYGEIPDAPFIDDTNFKVVRINEHLFDSKEQEDISKKSADKVKLKSEIQQIESSIESNKQILGNTTFKTEQERTSVKNTINSLIAEKTAKSALYDSLVLDLVGIAKEHNIVVEKPRYHIRGFFEIPDPKFNENTGFQEVIQFEYAYRYLRTDNKPAKAQQLEFRGRGKQTRRGTYSPWEYVKSSIRKRYYDEIAGIYKWQGEEIENPDVVNINQVDIPITKGEKVEIRIKSFSEAGWPINPIESRWSDTVTVTFPDELWVNDPTALALEQARNEESFVRFEASLRAKNVDLHLSTSTQTGDRYLAHDANMIASGFFDDSGIILNMYEKIQQLEAELMALRNQIDKKKGILQVAIVEGEINTIKTFVENGSTVDLFAGYYTDYIDMLPPNEKKGAIVTKVYRLVISNTEKAPLELVSQFPGGLMDRLPEVATEERTLTFDSENTTLELESSTLATNDILIGATIPITHDIQTEVMIAGAPTIVTFPANSIQIPANAITIPSQNLELASQNLDVGLNKMRTTISSEDAGSRATREDNDYFNRRRYWEVPINNLPLLTEETKNSNGIYAGNVQSRQLRSQFMYLRKKNIGLVTDLYKDSPGSRYLEPSITGTRTGSGTTLSGSSNAFVWGGSFNVEDENNIIPEGNGPLNDFCIHVDCPILQPKNGSNWNWEDTVPTIDDFQKPEIDLGPDDLPVSPMKVVAFRHAEFFNRQSTEQDGKIQLQFKDAWDYEKINGQPKTFDEITEEKEYQYQDKLGFYPHDRWLIGKNTCGCYLFAAPSYFDQLLVDGTDFRATKNVEFGENKAIVVPIIFQYRMVDFYGEGNNPNSGIIGGYTTDNTKSTNIQNIIYEKKLGIDINIKDEPMFSFDIGVSSKYSKKTQAEKVETVVNLGQQLTTLQVDKVQLKSL